MLLFHFKTLKSTHLWLKKHFFEIVEGTPKLIPFAAVTADHQTEGKGRSGGDWISLPESLFCSLLIPISEHMSRKHWGLFSIIGAHSLCSTLKKLAQHDPFSQELWVKWPNDVMGPDGKIGMVVVDTMESPTDESCFLILSFSVNLNRSIPHLRTASHHISVLQDITGEKMSVNKCFLALYKQVAIEFKQLFDGKAESLLSSLKKWAESRPLLRFKKDNQSVEGRLLYLLDDGSIIVRLSEGEEENFQICDITKVESFDSVDNSIAYSKA